MADGALRPDVFRALDEAKVGVEPTEQSSYYRVTRSETAFVVRMRDVVSRTVVDKLHRAFDIPKARFFPTELRIVPKAAGATSEEASAGS